MARDSSRFSLGTAELLGILAFWTALAVISAAGRRLDPRIDLAPNVASAVVSLSFIEYAIWAVLTVPIMWITSRFSFESGGQVRRIVLFVVIGVAVAVLVDWTIAQAREYFLPPPPNRRGRGGGRITGFQFLDDLMVYFAILGAGIARDY